MIQKGQDDGVYLTYVAGDEVEPSREEVVCLLEIRHARAKVSQLMHRCRAYTLLSFMKTQQFRFQHTFIKPLEYARFSMFFSRLPL